MGGITGGLLIAALLIWGGFKLLQNLPAATGSTMISDKDGMTLVYVPAGEFKMGSDNGDSDEKPVHTVTLDAFWIDQTEVTNSMYAKCVKDGKCDPPSSSKSYTQDNYYGNSMFDDYPVIYVSWNNAKTYCAWADRRLPTEAEWEKAARGTDGRTYPWGDNAPNNNLLNYDNAVGDTTEVGTYPNGASPYGALDMAGNVWEWVADWYNANYYATLGENVSNPRGPASGQDRVLRGGSWRNGVSNVRSSSRNWGYPASTYDYLGFRCSMGAAP
jgi:serine/threonine-protein kinase